MWYFIFFVIFVAFAYGVYKGLKSQKAFEALGYLAKDQVVLGSYLSGHPDLSANIPRTVLYPKKENLEIFQLNLPSMPKRIADIEIKLIKEITTFDRNVFKMKKQYELAHIVIQWFDGKFLHDTTFEIEGHNALQKANVARNQIIKMIKENA